MHYQREYEYPLYKRSEAEKMQLVAKGAVFANRPADLLMAAEPKSQLARSGYETKFAKAGGVGTSDESRYCTDYYYPKELHGWEKPGCNCGGGGGSHGVGVLAADYCGGGGPIAYQPVLPLSVDSRLLAAAASSGPAYSSQQSVCGNSNAAAYSKATAAAAGDFPLWLKIYSKASVECDHKLHWDMFNVRDLCTFDNVLIKLYELELEEIILWYKCYKNALLREMDKRLLEANQQRQMILLYNS